MMPTNDTMRMTDTVIEETFTAESRQSSITESVIEMGQSPSSEMAIAQTSEINGAESSERLEEVEDITEVEIISEETTPIK